eukprot:snap_masked-scaffold_58-processed-gene-0.65-mRNA-1 protein AED:1.00 eAED:1.00 QI:0/-1/0/0/-1/1/1/0/257
MAKRRRNTENKQKSKKVKENTGKTKSDDDNLGDEVTFAPDGTNEQVQLDLLFCDFHDSDYHITKLLLKQSDLRMFPEFESCISDLADTIVKNKATGSVIRLNDTLNEENEPSEICGFVSLLHLNSMNSEKEWSKLINSNILPNITTDNTGVLFLQKLVNVPDAVVLPLLQCLVKDIFWAKKNTKELNVDKNLYNFDQVIFPVSSFMEDSQFIAEPEILQELIENSIHRVEFASTEDLKREFVVLSMNKFIEILSFES